MTSLSTVAPDASPALRDTSKPRIMLARVVDDQQAFGDWLRAFDDDGRVIEVADRSYWHPNGFAKLVLQVGEDFKVRMHVWPAGKNRLGESNPHGHRWNFASTVLCGEGLRDTHYAEAETGMHYERYHYAGGNAVGALTRVGTTRLAKCGERTVRTGERYEVDTSILHTVLPLGTTLLATLVVQGIPCLTSAPVYGIPGVNVDEPGQPITPDDVRELIRDVLAAPDGPLQRVA